MKKDQYIFIGLIVLFIVLIIFSRIPATIYTYFSGDSGQDSYSISMEIINEKFPTDVMVYGENITYREEFKYRYLNRLNKAEIYKNADKSNYLFLIINDVNGRSKLNEDDVLLIKELLLDKVYRLSFIYFGKSKLEDMKKYGLFNLTETFPSTLSSLSDDDYGFSINNENNNFILSSGFWTLEDNESLNENKESLAQMSLFVIEDILKSNDQLINMKTS